MVTRGLMDALLRDPTAARRAGWREGVWGGGEEQEEETRGGGRGDYKLARMGWGGGEGREGKGWGGGRERSDREKKKMQPPKIKSKDCIRSEQRCRYRWQLRVSEFASPCLIHELE